MKRIQENPVGKLIAVILLVAFSFFAGMFGVKVIQALPERGTEHYQDTEAFSIALRQELNKVAQYFRLQDRLEGEQLDYLERREAEDELKQLSDAFGAKSTNLRWIVRDKDGEEVGRNFGHEEEEVGQRRFYASFVLGERSVDLRTQWDYNSSAPSAYVSSWRENRTHTIECSILSEHQMSDNDVRDAFYNLCYRYRMEQSNFHYWINTAIFCLGGAFLCLLYILWVCGHKAGEEEIVLSWQEKIWFDLYLLIMGTAFVLAFALAWYLMEDMWWSLGTYKWYAMTSDMDIPTWFQMGIAADCVALAGIVTLTLRTFVARLKGRALARSTLLCRVLMWCWRMAKLGWEGAAAMVRSLPFLWKTIALCLVYFFANLMLFTQARYDGWAGALWFLLNIGVFLFICWWAMGFQRLRKGGRAIAAGNLNHQVQTTRMPLDLKDHAEDLNNISGGLQNAVEQQMRSERFKSELITNVSHDLKTPLTSIINYVDLLKTTEQADPKAVEYIAVLDRKSQRLKKLTEDLVEASKASTGTLSVVREKLGMSQLIDQALGEYEEKLENRRLAVIITQPEDETYVYGDGRHLWRVIDNLLSNCCKYAMEGTRVYLELTRGKGQVVLSVKNISREPLNVPPERLMERFVRGEESRSTEGSGLGLSIARSLTELQGGTFELAVDGDLFKAIVTMPQAG